MMKDLLRVDQQLREDQVSVVPIPGISQKVIDRKVVRPWHPLPNIKDFVIEIRPFDWLTSLFGFLRRQPTKTTMYTWLNGKPNLYVDYMFRRLRKAVLAGDKVGAQNAIWILMTSSSYQVVGINHVMRNWHRKLTWKEVRILAKQVHKLAKRRATNIDFARAYIPKNATSKDMRPLGVPTPAWRVYLHMYNNCLVEWRQVTEPGNQHAYLPGRGVITAWRDLTKMLNKPHIFEADFKGFFDKVRHDGIEMILYNQLRLPFSETEFILALNKSLVKLQQVDKVKEKDRDYALKADGSPNPQARPPLHHRIQEIGWDRETIHIEYLPDRLYLEQAKLKKKEGVPQGAPTSCSLATLVLRFLNHLDVILYADDVIYFPKTSNCDPVKDLTFWCWGLFVHEEKSRWIKKDGVWLVDSFKFLGLRYFPGLSRVANTMQFLQCLLLMLAFDLCLGYLICTPLYVLWEIFFQNSAEWERFEADTRNGAKLKFTFRESFLSYLAIAREILLENPYMQEKWNEKSLTEWLLHNFSLWEGLKSKAKLLFATTKRSEEDKAKSIKFWEDHLVRVRARAKDPDGKYNEQDIRKAKAILKYEKSRVGVDNPLTGYFLSRMQTDSWHISVKQNFKLRYISGSWVDTQWMAYAWEWILPSNKLTVFIASSFACHALVNEIRDMKKGQPRIRWVQTNRLKNLSSHELELLKILVMFRDNVG